MPVSCTTSSRSVQAWKPYGDVEIREFCAATGENKICNLGQVSEVNIAYEIEEDSLPDYRRGQGEAAADSRISSMGLGMVCHEMGDLDVLATLMLGERATVAANAGATQDENAYLGKPLWLDNLPTSITSIVSKSGTAATAWVTATAYAIGDAVVPSIANDLWYQAESAGTSDAGEPTWPTNPGDTVDDNGITWRCMGRIQLETPQDYTVDNFGPQIADSARIYTGPENDIGIEMTVTYDHADQSVMHAGMHTGKEYEVRFKGYNKAISDRLMLVHIWRAKSAPPDQLPLIATEYAGANTTFKILSYDGAAADESSFWNYREIATA